MSEERLERSEAALDRIPATMATKADLAGLARNIEIRAAMAGLATEITVIRGAVTAASLAMETILTELRELRVHPAGRSYYRLVADLVIEDGAEIGTDVSAALVGAGAAWNEPRYSDRSAPAHQAAAQRLHRGLWADPNPVPLWQWRHTHPHS